MCPMAWTRWMIPFWRVLRPTKRMQGRRHGQVADQRVHHLAVAHVPAGDGAGRADPLDREVALLGRLVAEAQDADAVSAVVKAGQLPGQVLDVDAGAAVDVRRILVG